ncbi:MAG: tetratricopeptide repeat protein [Treponema sp.]|nr:tetratricopeptide repeat protein [Treponema sp.]
MVVVVIIGVLIAFIVSISIIIVKNMASPKQMDGIDKLIKQGKIQQAIKAAKSVTARNPRDYTAHYLLGKAYLADNKSELAFLEYKTVNENAVFNGDIPETEFRKKMAELYQKYNESENALKEYLLLTKLEPQNAENDYNVGKLYEQQGKAPLAMGFYQKALTVNKKHAKSWTAIGYLLYRSKQYGEAKKAIDTSIKLNPENYSNYYYLGKILKDNKDLSGACKALEKAQRDPAFRQKALIERGSCLMLAGQTDQAITEYENAIKASKNDSSQETLYARYFLASCYEKARKIDKAIEQWEIIFRKNKNFRDVTSKLNEYKELQNNDSIKEFLTSGNQQFMEMCKKIAKAGFNLESQKTEPTPYGCQMIATEAKGDNWMNVRQQLYLLDFYRETEPLEENAVRRLADKLKAQGCNKGLIITSSEFARAAVQYAESRPLQLVAKDQLEKIMAKAGL